MNSSPLRYFFVVRLHPVHHLAILAGVSAVAIWTVMTSPGELDSSVRMLLFVQMFVASTGFLPRARRGHFDPILTSSVKRVRVIVSHWFVSVFPGVVTCVLVIAVDWIYGGTVPSTADGRRLLALFIVSVVTWTAGFALTRGAGGALWAAGLVAVLLHRSDLLGSAPAAPGSLSAPTVARHAAAAIACPFLLLGTHPPLVPASIAAAGCTAALLLLAVCRSASGIDFYLRDRA